VLLSDLHFGDGGSADDFRDNEDALIAALTHYQKRGYELILLGDIEEFWQFDLERIRGRYDRSVYRAIRTFTDDRIHRVFGNHDIDWETRSDPAKNEQVQDVGAVEGLKFEDAEGKVFALLVHGHQGSVESDKNSWISRVGVRLFAKVESVASFLGLYGHESATKSMVATDYERVMYRWAKRQKVMLFCGHSHRAIFAARSYYHQLREKAAELQRKILAGGLDDEEQRSVYRELEKTYQKIWEEQKRGRGIDPTESAGMSPKPCYFNTGCGLYRDGLTALEIADDQVRLVKWPREVPLSGEPKEFRKHKLSEFIAEVCS
jgi:UDP-2,3-diacylglucosamine pyrophosphatase LpxH